MYYVPKHSRDHADSEYVSSGITTAPQTPHCGGGRRIKGPFAVEKEEEILALGSNTSPGRGPIHGVFCGGPGI